ncbi:glycosyltransferase [archaeon]|nr:glycosyltransferase [archaeon]
MGGSSVDLMGLLNKLTEKGFEVTLFLPLVEDEQFFPAGLVNPPSPPFDKGGKGKIRFEIVQIPIKLSQYNKSDFIEIIGKAVDDYKPEFLFLGDMYSFKPYLAERLKKYKTIWRFYAYGLLCPRCTLLNKEGEVCKNTYLNNKDECEICLRDKLQTNGDEPIYRELREADIFSGGYMTLLKKGLEDAHFIVVYNDIQKEILSRSIKNKNIAVIPTGIDMKRFTNNELRTTNHEQQNTILMSGRISDPAKGFSTFHKAFSGLRERHKDIRLLVTSKYDFTEEGIESETKASIAVYALMIYFVAMAGGPALLGVATAIVKIIVVNIGVFPTVKTTGLVALSQASVQQPALGAAKAAISYNFVSMIASILIVVNAVFSSLILGILNTGNEKNGIKLIPVILVVSLVVYWIAGRLLDGIFGGLTV